MGEPPSRPGNDERAAKVASLADEIEDLPPQDRVNMEIIVLVLSRGEEQDRQSLLEAMRREPSSESVRAVREWIAEHPHWIRRHLELYEGRE